MTPPTFFASGREERVTLDGPEGRHAADVRRLRVGESVWLTDGKGTRGVAVVDHVRRGAVDLVVSEWLDIPPPQPRLVVVQALAKGGRDEAAVEAMTEVGVDEVAGWAASRAVAKWTERTAAKWRSTAEAASRQARRSWWPTITGPLSTADVASRLQAATVALVLHEDATAGLSAVAIPVVGEIAIVVGPEGGIADDELETFAAAGAQPVRLGDSVLRSSTAGVAALAAFCARTRWA